MILCSPFYHYNRNTETKNWRLPKKSSKIDEIPGYFQCRIIETKKAEPIQISISLSVSAYFFVKSLALSRQALVLSSITRKTTTVQVHRFKDPKNLTGKSRKFAGSRGGRTCISTIFALERQTNTEMYWSISIYTHFQSEEIELQWEVPEVEISRKGRAITLDICVRYATVKNSCNFLRLSLSFYIFGSFNNR